MNTSYKYLLPAELLDETEAMEDNIFVPDKKAMALPPEFCGWSISLKFFHDETGAELRQPIDN